MTPGRLVRYGAVRAMRFAFRREDRRNLIVGFVGLMAIMTAHSVMETARDTLFLTSLPATDLPRAYLAIALLAILELKVHERVLPHVRDRRIGKPAATRRDVVDSTYDYAMVLGFEDLADHNAYQVSAEHQAFLDTCFRMIGRVQVYDVDETD